MKPLSVVHNLRQQLSEESRQATVDSMLIAQIEAFERVMENNGGNVKSPMSYNMCIGLVQQLKYYALASFKAPETLMPEEINFDSIREYAAGKAGNLFGKS